MADPAGPWPFPTTGGHATVEQGNKPVAIEPSEDALDHGIEETFPASDPVAVTVTTAPCHPKQVAEVSSPNIAANGS